MSKSRLETEVSKHHTRTRPAKVSRVPPAILDRVVQSVKVSRAYALESFTQADWDAVRVRLPLEYRWLSNDQLTRQACNRRKQGAYTTKAKRSAATRWSKVKQIVRSYWSGGTSLEELGDFLKKLGPVATSKRDGNKLEATTLSTRAEQVSTAIRPQKAHLVVKAKMRALSIRQPFAEQILSGKKRIEYRSLRTHIRGRVYIYACKAPGDADSYEGLPRGKLVGTVELVDCTGEEGEFEWHLANPRRLRTPLTVEGMPQPGFFWPFGQ